MSAVEHLKYLEVPGSSEKRGESPGRMSRSEDFAAGYSLGLIGGVKSWMMRQRHSLRDSQAASPDGSEDDDMRSPISNDGEQQSIMPVLKTPPLGRGRKGQSSGSLSDSKRDTLDVIH